MGRPKKYKNPVRLSIIVEKEQKEHLCRQARKMTQIEDRVVTVNELGQNAIDIVFPMPRSQMKFKV